MIEIISFWFIIWFILYYFDIIKYNPLIFIIITYVLNLFETIYLYMMTSINKNPFETYEKLMDGYINNTNFKTIISKFYDFLLLLIINNTSS